VSRPEILIRRAPGVGIVELKGEHDEYAAPRLADQLNLLLEHGVDVLVDLREATFIGATTVGVLLSAHKRAEKRSRRLVVLLDETAGLAVRRLIELTMLESVIPVFATRLQALEALGPVESKQQAG